MNVHILCEGRTLCSGLPIEAHEPGDLWVGFETQHSALRNGVTCYQCWVHAAMQWPGLWLDQAEWQHVRRMMRALQDLKDVVDVELDRERLIDTRED